MTPEIQENHYAKRFEGLPALRERFGSMRPGDSIALSITDLETLRLLISMYQEAVAVQGDDEVLKYITSGNGIPVSRCTVSADLIRQLVAKQAHSKSEYRRMTAQGANVLPPKE